MFQGQTLILYVKNPAESAAFYARLLGREPVDVSPNFAMFALGEHSMLGLWASHDVVPGATPAGGAELCLTVADDAAVDACQARWTALGAQLLQGATAMDFGYTFTVQDLDGHRVRVFAPAVP